MPVKKKQPLPWLAPNASTDPENQYYHPDYLCKISTYHELIQREGFDISLQALYLRVRAGTIPAIHVDETPFILLCAPLDMIRNKPEAIRVNGIAILDFACIPEK
jgi:hypothetical protein